MLKVKVKSLNDFLFKSNKLLSIYLLAKEVREFVDHHLEAWVHVLVQLGSKQQTNCSKLNQVGSHLALLCQGSKISICDTHSDVECFFAVLLNSVQLLDQTDHALTILWLNSQVILTLSEVVSNGFILLHHGEVAGLRVLWSGLSSLVSPDIIHNRSIINIKSWNLLFDLVHPS